VIAIRLAAEATRLIATKKARSDHFSVMSRSEACATRSSRTAGSHSGTAYGDERTSAQALIGQARNAPSVAATRPPARPDGDYASLEDALIAADLDFIVSDARERQAEGAFSPRDTFVLVLDALADGRLDLAGALLAQGSARGDAGGMFGPFVMLAEGDSVEAVAAMQEAAAGLPAPMADIATALILEAAGELDDAALIYRVVESQLDTTPLEGEPRTLEEFQESLNSARTYAALMQAGLVNHRLGNRAEAEEVLQEAYTSIWLKASSFDPGLASAYTWLATITRHKAIDRRRARRVHEPLEAATQWAAKDTVIDSIERERQGNAIDRCLATLAEDQQRYIRVAFFEGCSYAELAERHSIPLGTMKSCIRRGLLVLRGCLGL
jgi:RNA polymerase sigma-70 factor (ECF subfamily)